MAELIKNWNDGRELLVAYTGDKDGTAVFSSEANESLDVEIGVEFRAGNVVKARTVRQEGLREVFNCAEGAFSCSDGNINVIKNKYNELQ